MKPEFNHIYIRRFIVCNAFASWPLGACLLRMLRKLGTGKEDEEPENEKIGANQRVANEFTDRYFSQFSFSRSPLSLLVTLHCFVRRVVGVANLFLFWRFSILFSFFFVLFFSFFYFPVTTFLQLGVCHLRYIAFCFDILLSHTKNFKTQWSRKQVPFSVLLYWIKLISFSTLHFHHTVLISQGHRLKLLWIQTLTDRTLR